MNLENIYKKYQYRFINILNKLEPTYKDKGDILELFIAIKNINNSNNSEITLLYDDVPIEIKNKYSLSFKDTGIDLITFNNETKQILKIIQCKNYSRRLSHHKLGTFYYWMLKLHEQDENIKYKLVMNNKTRYNGQLINLEIEIISSSDIIEYLESNYSSISQFCSFCSEILLSQFKSCIYKFDSIYSNFDQNEENEFKIVINSDKLNEIDEINEVCSINYNYDEPLKITNVYSNKLKIISIISCLSLLIILLYIIFK